MSLAFDLISDLHVETWPDFDWSEQATSPYAIVAGDVARDRTVLLETLTHLAQCYQAVFYIDGNDEHRHYYQDLNSSYADLVQTIKKIPNIVFLQDNVAVVDGVAILGTNGWWTYDFDQGIDAEQTSLWFQEQCQVSAQVAKTVGRLATNDATYMINSVKRLQTHNDVKKIICVTHTVPDAQLIAHDMDLDGSIRFNTMGNRFMTKVLSADTEHKIHTWCFGHYHGSADQVRHNVRFVNNCRGRGDTKWRKYVYHPLRIVIDV
jgi:predicted phosphohydrolase